MALQWNWNESVGTAVIESRYEYENEVKEIPITLYEGNAYLIMLHEYNKDGTDVYDMVSFFCDKTHMNNCLGITKGMSNILDEDYCRLKKIRLNKKKSRYYKTIISALIKAFDNIDIEIYSEEE